MFLNSLSSKILTETLTWLLVGTLVLGGVVNTNSSDEDDEIIDVEPPAPLVAPTTTP